MRQIDDWKIDMFNILPWGGNLTPKTLLLPHYHLDDTIRDQLSEHIYTEHEED